MLFTVVAGFLEFINTLLKVLKWTSYFIHEVKISFTRIYNNNNVISLGK